MDEGTGAIDWVARQGGLNNEIAESIAVDDVGDVYVLNRSTYQGNPLNVYQARTVVSIPETYWGSTTQNSATQLGINSIYLIKYDSDGNIIYSNNINVLNSSSVISGRKIIVNHNNGEVAIAGLVSGTGVKIFNSKNAPGAPQSPLKNLNLPSGGTGSRGFLAKFDVSGNPIWFDVSGSNQPSSIINSITFAPLSSCIYGCGYSTNSIQLGSQNLALPGTNLQGFYFKYSE